MSANAQAEQARDGTNCSRADGTRARRTPTTVQASVKPARPKLVFFYSGQSGRCRRVEGFLAQVLQQRRNHGTFSLYRVEQTDRPDLVKHFAVDTLPTLVVVEGRQVRARLESPRGCREIESFLSPWLR